MTDFSDLPFLDLSDPAFSTRGPEIAAARSEHWCARTPYGLAVLRHNEVGHLLRDRRLRQGSYNWPEINDFEGPFADFWKNSVIGREGPSHKRLRNLVIPALSPAYVESLVPAFDRIAADLCGELRQISSCEFQEAFSTPFAGQAITTLLGMGREDWPQVAHDASELGLAMGVECKSYTDRFDSAYLRLRDLSEELVKRVRIGKGKDSFVARMVAGFERTPGATEAELLDLIVISIFGGVDTTRGMLSLGLSLFIDNPDQWAILRQDASLVPVAIEEMIRARPTTTWATRETVEDITFRGLDIPAGTTLHMMVHASARDPLICDDPAFDITKTRRKHFGFGGGSHHCIGHLVARTDMAAAYRALRKLFVTVEYDGSPVWRLDSGNTGPVRLPIKYIAN